MKQRLFQQALRREAIPTPPIWMMRQAGRYHHHYQSMKQKHSFMELCKKPDLAAEVAMGPIRDFDFDVSILFSDLLFPLEVLGMPLEYNPGPKLGYFLEHETQLKEFKNPKTAVRGMDFQAEAVRKTRELLPQEKSLIGFVGGPWTLFVYAVEGSHKGDLSKSLSKLDLFKKFCELMVPFLQENIQLQLEAGAELVLVMDTAAGELSSEVFRQHILPSLRPLLSQKTGYYLKQGKVEHYAALENQAAGFGYDHNFSIAEVLKNTQHGFVQGNFNQDFMTLPKDVFEEKFQAFIDPILKLSPKERAGWVANLGHGITPLAREENVRLFVQGIRKHFK